jgi:hypothetical protein
MRGLAAILMALLAAMAVVVIAQPYACPLIARLKTKPSSKASGGGVMAGGKVTVTLKVLNSRKLSLGQGGVAINLPPGLCVVSSRPRGAQLVPTSGNIFWPNVDFGKKKLHRFRLKARVHSSYNGSVATLNAHAYIPPPGLGCTASAASVQVSDPHDQD